MDPLNTNGAGTATLDGEPVTQAVTTPEEPAADSNGTEPAPEAPARDPNDRTMRRLEEIRQQDAETAAAFDELDAIMAAAEQKTIQSDDASLSALLAEARTITSRGVTLVALPPSIRTVRKIERAFEALAKVEDQGQARAVDAEVQIARRLFQVEEQNGSVRMATADEIEEAFDRDSLIRAVFEALGIEIGSDEPGQKKMLARRSAE